MAEKDPIPESESRPTTEDLHEEPALVQEPVAAEAPPQEEPPAKPKPPSRMGRFLRAALRLAVVAVILFGLGVLVTYLVLYQPAAQQLAAAQKEAQTNATQLEQARAELQKTSSEFKTAQAQVGELQTRLDVELARVQVLRSMNEITKARMALAAEDKEGALKALNDSQAFLEEILPMLAALDPAQADTLTALYTLTKNDLNRDNNLVTQDLDRLQTELELAEKNVLKRTE